MQAHIDRLPWGGHVKVAVMSSGLVQLIVLALFGVSAHQGTTIRI